MATMWLDEGGEVVTGVRPLRVSRRPLNGAKRLLVDLSPTVVGAGKAVLLMRMLMRFERGREVPDNNKGSEVGEKEAGEAHGPEGEGAVEGEEACD